jgi:hypothetical protein
MRLLQLGHIERGGFAIDFEIGSLYMQTFKKLPTHMPKINNMTTISIFDMFCKAPS